MKRWFVVSLAVIAIGVVVGIAILKKPAPPKPQPLTVLFTCDVRGRLVPCGCFTGQLGGLTRIATLFGKDDAPGELRVDVGDAIAGGADYERIEYRYIQEAFAKMRYAALNVGWREAGLSAAQLREIKARARVPMVSANLLDKATGAPLFDTHKIVRRGAWRIALIGVLDPHGLGDALGEGLAVEEMNVALGRLLPKLRGQADFIVLLAFVDEAAMANLARQFYELDAILGGKVRQPSQKLVKENLEPKKGNSLEITGDDAATSTHMDNLLGAIRTGQTLRAPIADAAKSVHLCHLGNISQYTGHKLRTDPRNGHIVSDAGAARYWSRSYAPGWAPTV